LNFVADGSPIVRVKLALVIAACIAGAVTDAIAAECFTYQHECVYRPGEPDRRSLRDQLRKPIWAPDPPPPPPPVGIRPKLSQPYYGLPTWGGITGPSVGR
jgi:hypothetical protein